MVLKPFDGILKSDIEALIENKVREGRTIEYKQVLPGSSDKDKREFLADISSFANAGGGDLLYGISAKEGIPLEVLGLDGNLDHEMLLLENLIRDSLDPRVYGLQMKPIDGFVKGSVLLVRVVNSWVAPHRVTFKGSSRFFSRNSAGKYPLDTSELRTAFLLSDALPEKMRSFRDERLGKIIANETPVFLKEGAKVILHVLPVASFTIDTSFDVSVLKKHARDVLEPIGGNGCSSTKYNLDGFVTCSGSNKYDAGSREGAYSIIFRKGQIESVSVDFVGEDSNNKLSISSKYLEESIITCVLGSLRILRSLEIPSPLALFLCITGVSNVSMSTYGVHSGGTPIDRDTLIIPDILIEDYESISDLQEVATVLRPVFDAVWNACGYERSLNYDRDGKWVAAM